MSSRVLRMSNLCAWLFMLLPWELLSLNIITVSLLVGLSVTLVIFFLIACLHSISFPLVNFRSYYVPFFWSYFIILNSTVWKFLRSFEAMDRLLLWNIIHSIPAIALRLPITTFTFHHICATTFSFIYQYHYHLDHGEFLHKYLNVVLTHLHIVLAVPI